jgi:hypothetical protein
VFLQTNKLVEATLALVVPFVVFIPLTAADRFISSRWPAVTDICVYTSYAISATVGFVILVRAFGRYAALSAIVYFPLMFRAFVYYSLYIAWYLYGDTI